MQSMAEVEEWIGRREEMLRVVRKVLIERLKVQRAPDEIDPDAPLFGTGLGLDSVDAVELVVSLEVELGVTIPDAVVSKGSLRTVGTLVDLLLDVASDRCASRVEGRAGDVADAHVRAVREGVALSRAKLGRDRTVALRFSGGDGAWESLQQLCSGDLFLRDGQATHTLWLDPDGLPLADVYVARDDADFVVLAEGRGADLVAHAERQLRGGATVEDLSTSHHLVSLHGPFAWELLGIVVGAEVVGLPYLSLFHLLPKGHGWVLRAGMTGEFGYDLLIANADENVERRLLDAGKRFDLILVGQEVVDQCRLENWFFDIRRDGLRGLSPDELQLQWRVSREKEFVGSAALAQRRAHATHRIITLVSKGALRPGAEVRLFGQPVGRVVEVGWSAVRGDWVALALIVVRSAHAGIDAFEVDGVAVRSVTPPLLDNRSLHVNPQRHSYATRGDAAFPGLVR